MLLDGEDGALSGVGGGVLAGTGDEGSPPVDSGFGVLSGTGDEGSASVEPDAG